MQTPKLSVPAAEPGARSEGVPVAIDVRYEPSSLGEVQDVLTVSSPDGGSYTCSLFGRCEAPKPQGPIVIRSGASAQVLFKNVLDAPDTFNFNVDNAAFSLSKKSDKIARKATSTLTISFKATSASKDAKEAKADLKSSAPAAAAVSSVAPAAQGPEIGRLLITCPSLRVNWVYYLQGLRS